MAKYAGVNFALFLVDQYNLIASLSESVSMGKEAITQQTNPFGVTSEQHTPVGIEKGMLSVSGGFFDPTGDALHTITGAAATQTSRIVSAAIEGNTIGKHFMGFQGSYRQKFEVLDKRDELVKANVSYLVSGQIDEGTIIQSLTAITADQIPPTADTPVDYTTDPGQRVFAIATASKAAACVITCTKNHGLTTGQKVFISGNTLSGPAINGDFAVTVTGLTTFTIAVNTTGSTGTGSDGTFVYSSTVAGGVGYLHVTAFSGFTGVLPSIMHSSDDTTYASLIAFTNVTAITKERLTVSGTVDRYLSSKVDVTGSGSVTPFMGFCRN